MPVFVVIRKTDGVEMTRYLSGQITERINEEDYPLTEFDHIEYNEEQPVDDSRKYGGRRLLTKLEFVELLGDAAYAAILGMARASVQVEAWVKKMEITTPDENGYSVNLDDPRTIAGIVAMGDTLVAQGVVSEAWTNEVLNG